MRSHFRSTGNLLAAVLAMVACSPPGPQSSHGVAKPLPTPPCGPDPVVEGYVLAETIRCTWSIASSCSFAGSAYEHGLGVGRDRRRAREYHRQACDLGSQDDCAMFGRLTFKLGEKERYPELVAIWERACEKGSVFGCHTAGLAWTVDAAELGVATDVARGRAFFGRACAARYMVSCGVEARLVVQTKDTASYATAQAGLVKACALDERESCHFLAQTELHGTFESKNEAAAAGHFWEACRFGWAAGCGALAYLNAVGVGVPKDSDKARKLAEVSCKELHYEPACKAAQTSDFALLAPEVP
jgi:TPR repeat protein